MRYLLPVLFSMLPLLGCDDADDGDGESGPTITEVLIQPAEILLYTGESHQMKAIATYSDGQQRDISADVSWVPERQELLSSTERGEITALAEGESILGAGLEIGELRFFPKAKITVKVLKLESISISPEAVELNSEQRLQLRAVGLYTNGYKEEITDRVSWSSSDSAVISVTESGEALGVQGGEVKISAELESQKAEVPGIVACFYPSYPDTVRFSKTMPPLYWESAFQRGEEFNFQLKDLYCDEETYGDYSVIAFVVGAGWCSACTAYTRDILKPKASSLENAGVLIVFLEAQDENYEPSDSAYADRHLTRLVGKNFGIRVGSLDTQPVANYLTEETNGYIQAFPTVFVVRRSDMKIIADGTRSQNYLPLEQIARNPYDDWSNPDDRFRNLCDGQEEDLEPNNSAADAAAIEPGSFDGGICNPGPDYFRVNIPGAWRADLEFSHSTGNLDLWVWDERQDAPVLLDGVPVGSYSDDDNESLEYEGPALIRIDGLYGASAPYTFNLTEL